MQKFVHSKHETNSDVHSNLASHGVTEQSSETIEGHQHAATKRQTDMDKARMLVLIMIPALGLLQLALLYPLGVVGYLFILMGLLIGLAGIFTATRIYRTVIRFGLPMVAVLSLISGFVTVTNPSEDWVNGPRWLASRGAKMWEPEFKTVREESELFVVQQRMFTENSSHPSIKSTAGWLAPGAVTRVAKAPKMIRVETREMAEKLWKNNTDVHTRYHQQRVSGIQRMYSAFADALEAGIFQTKPALDSGILWLLIVVATSVGDLLAGTLRALRRRKDVEKPNS